MNKDKKLINTLTALSGEITVRNIEERHLKNGKTCFDMYVEHVVHYTPCSCGSKMIKKHGTKPAWAMHVPQGKRSITRIHYDRQRFKCKSCGATFLEDIHWIHNGSHLTVSLFDCIDSDVRTLMTKNDIARVNAVTVHFVDYVLKELKPPIPSHLPEVICIDETFAQVKETLNEKTSWIRFVTNLSNGQTGELLDIMPFRNKKNLVHYFKKNFTYHNRCSVKHLCCDGADYYISLAEKCFPNATVCLDNFHVSNYVRTGLTSVRNKQQNYLLSKSEIKNDRYYREYIDLKYLSHKLDTSAFHQKFFWRDNYVKYVARIKHHLSECPELKDAYFMLQYYYLIFHMDYDFKQKTKDLDTWISIFGKSTSEAISATVRSVELHLPYIHNAWKSGYSNATCEGNNNLIQTLKHMSFGIHSFDYFRTRALLIAGSPGASRNHRKPFNTVLDCTSFFFEESPSLKDYVLAYDWTNPKVDMSEKGV